MTKGLIKSSKKCDKLFKNVCGLPRDDQRFLDYKSFRNLLIRLKKQARRSYYAQRVAKYNSDIRKLWKVLRDNGKVQ